MLRTMSVLPLCIASPVFFSFFFFLRRLAMYHRASASRNLCFTRLGERQIGPVVSLSYWNFTLTSETDLQMFPNPAWFCNLTSWRKTNRSSCSLSYWNSTSETDLHLSFQTHLGFAPLISPWRLLFGKLISNTRKNVGLHFKTPRNRSKYGIKPLFRRMEV